MFEGGVCECLPEYGVLSCFWSVLDEVETAFLLECVFEGFEGFAFLTFCPYGGEVRCVRHSLCCFFVVFVGAKIVKILQCQGVFSGKKKFCFFCCFLLAVSKKSVFLRCSLKGFGF